MTRYFLSNGLNIAFQGAVGYLCIFFIMSRLNPEAFGRFSEVRVYLVLITIVVISGYDRTLILSAIHSHIPLTKLLKARAPMLIGGVITITLITSDPIHLMLFIMWGVIISFDIKFWFDAVAKTSIEVIYSHWKNLGLTLACVYLIVSTNENNISTVFLLGSCIGLAIYTALCWRKKKVIVSQLPALNQSEKISITNGILQTLNNFISIFSLSIGVILSGHFAESGLQAIYGVANVLVTGFLLLFNNALLRTYVSFYINRSLPVSLSKYCVISTLLIVLCLLLCYNITLIFIDYVPKYYLDNLNVLYPYIIGIVITIAFNVFGHLMTIEGKNSILLIFNLVSMVTHALVVLLCFLIGNLELLGWGWLTAVVTMVVLTIGHRVNATITL